MWRSKRARREIEKTLQLHFPDETFHWVDRSNTDLSQTDLSHRGVVVDDVLSDLDDIWQFFRTLRRKCAVGRPCLLVHSNSYWQQILGAVASPFRTQRTRPPSWLSHSDIANLMDLNGFEIVSFKDRPLLAWLRIYFLRPIPNWVDEASATSGPSVSVIVPARDEKGNIQRCIQEVSKMGSETELIFVEGGSKDGTREEIERAIRDYKGPLTLRLVLQTKADGKGGACRLGFEAAKGDILMILDSDLTVVPKDLPKFYLALTEGRGDFIMGSRLVYPLEKEAMRTLNIFGNKFFSLMFTWLLGRPIKDTLCGTKVLRRSDYQKIAANRARFGDFDPFGDYDLIFGAAMQGLKIVEIPVRYHARTYGDTKISRFTHGWLLLKMCVFAFRHFKMR